MSQKYFILFSNKAKKVEKNVGEAVNNVKKVANPMK